MFTSIDENAFKQAIKDKDYLALKVSTVSTMLDDPTFERGETMRVIQILKEQVPEIFEDEVKIIGKSGLPCLTHSSYIFKSLSSVSYKV